MMKATDLRKGRAVIYEDKIFVVHDAQRVAKGNWRSYMQIKLKNLQSGQIIDMRFRMDETLETPFMQTKEYEFLYDEPTQLILMDTETYDQLHVDKDLLGDTIKFLKPNERVTCMIADGAIIGIELPNVVELEVTDAPPQVKGATATNQSKEVTLETGAKVRVPPFIDNGTVIRVDTRTGDYLERAKG